MTLYAICGNWLAACAADAGPGVTASIGDVVLSQPVVERGKLIAIWNACLDEEAEPHRNRLTGPVFSCKRGRSRAEAF